MKKYINSKPYVKAMMEELIKHKIKFAFLIRMGPIPIGIQNLVLSVCFFIYFLFIIIYLFY